MSMNLFVIGPNTLLPCSVQVRQDKRILRQFQGTVLPREAIEIRQVDKIKRISLHISYDCSKLSYLLVLKPLN